MSVKMSYASSESGVLVHISQKKTFKEFYCPECRKTVIPKTGKKNAHHFAHVVDENCSFTEETALHFGAKHYLAEAVNGKIESPLLSFPFNSLSNLISKISTLLNVEPSHQVTLQDVCSFYMERPVAKVENALGSYLIDVLVNDIRYIERNLAIEVLVTHESTNEKIKHFKQQAVPFLELRPVSDDKGHFTFKVHDFYLPEFFSSIEKDYEKKLAALIYRETKPLLLKEVNKEVAEVEQLLMKIKAVNALKREVESLNISESFGTAEKNGYSYIDSNSHPQFSSERVELRSISPEWLPSSKFPRAKVNEQYFVSSIEKQFMDLVNKLADQFAVDIRIGHYKNQPHPTVLGIGLHVPSVTVWEEETKQKILAALNNYEKRFNKKLVKLQSEEK